MFDEKSYSLKMDKTIEVFSKELTSLRTGRANSAMLDLIKVDVYGQKMPINQIGSITTPESRMINIQVWDSSNVTLIDAAIKKIYDLKYLKIVKKTINPYGKYGASNKIVNILKKVKLKNLIKKEFYDLK